MTRGKSWGKKEWIVKYWLAKNENPFPERYSIRQAFYEEIPRIYRFVKEVNPIALENMKWVTYFYSDFIGYLSDLVLAKQVSYRHLNIYDDSGAARHIWQYTRPCYQWGDAYTVEYPIEVWVENNATFNSLSPLFDGEGNYRINILSQKGFAKTQQIESLYLDRSEDVKVILSLTDFDPSGYNMPSDLQNRLSTIGLNIEVTRIGILPNQIPEERRVASLMPYKKTDSRTKWFVEKFKDDPMVQQGYGYEMQALNPTELRTLVSGYVENTISEHGFEKRED